MRTKHVVLAAIVAGLAACDRTDSSAEGSAPANPAVAETSSAAGSIGAPQAASTGDPVLDAMIEQIEASGDSYQIELRTFRTVPAAFALLPLEPNEDGTPQPPEAIAWATGLVERQVPPDIRDRIAQAASARVLFMEDCGADTAVALGVPESYFPDYSGGGLLDRARLISAARAAGIDWQTAVGFERDFGEGDGMLRLNRALANEQADDGAPPAIVLDMSDGCGAGEILVTFRTDPPAAALRLIPAFFFSICQRQGRDPWSADECRWWKDVLRDGGEMVAGTYHYVAATTDGRERRGKLSVTENALQTADGMPAETISIRI
jgi:hypothetical protein